MEKLQSLPFKNGHHVESRSFSKGYRGAWFRCQVKKICKKGASFDYYDFPEDGIKRMKSVYHKPPWKSKGAKAELMLRPQFPPVYCQGEVPDVNTLTEVIVVRNSAWKVGDLADWYCDGCYWSGTITELRGDDKVQFQLHPPPVGEGLSYEASCKDLRPSLEWSPETGWKVSVPKGKPNHCPCARLIQPINQGKLENQGKKDSEAAQESLPELDTSASPSSAHSLPSSHREKGPENQNAVAPQKERQDQGEKNQKMDVDALDSVIGKGSFSDSVSSASLRASAEVPGEALCKEHAPENETSKRVGLSMSLPLNSSTCDSVQSLFVDLEELLNKVKWVRRFLEPPESGKAGWKFQEYRAGGSRPARK